MRAGSRWANRAPKELSLNSCPTACREKLSQNNFGLLLTKSNWLNPKVIHPCRALLASDEQSWLYQLDSSRAHSPSGSSQPQLKHDCSFRQTMISPLMAAVRSTAHQAGQRGSLRKQAAPFASSGQHLYLMQNAFAL